MTPAPSLSEYRTAVTLPSIPMPAAPQCTKGKIPRDPTLAVHQSSLIPPLSCERAIPPRACPRRYHDRHESLSSGSAKSSSIDRYVQSDGYDRRRTHRFALLNTRQYGSRSPATTGARTSAIRHRCPKRSSAKRAIGKPTVLCGDASATVVICASMANVALVLSGRASKRCYSRIRKSSTTPSNSNVKPASQANSREAPAQDQRLPVPESGNMSYSRPDARSTELQSLHLFIEPSGTPRECDATDSPRSTWECEDTLVRGDTGTTRL